MSRGLRQGGSCRPEEQLCFGTRLKCSKFLLERESCAAAAPAPGSPAGQVSALSVGSRTLSRLWHFVLADGFLKLWHWFW